MMISGASLAHRVAGVVGYAAGTRGAVLCFHGLDVEVAPSRSSMHVPLQLFEAIVTLLRRVGTIVPLSELVSRQIVGRGTAGLVALTADDAYASLLAAESFLVAERVPFSVFVVSDAVATGRAFWWDRMEDLLPCTSPARWRQFEDECGLPEAYRRGHRADEGSLGPLRQWLLAVHRGRLPNALEQPLARLEQELGRRTAQRSMNEAELAGFVARTGAQVGIHTVSHATLPLLGDGELIHEVAHCHEQLRSRFRDVLPYLALPFGLFDARTLELAAKAGMTTSLTLTDTPLSRRFRPEVGMSRSCVDRDHTPGILALKISRIGPLLSRIRGWWGTPYPDLPSPN